MISWPKVGPRWQGLLLFAGFYLLWLVNFWPAIGTVWWFADDFWMMERLQAGESARIYELANSAGRPVTALLFLLHPWSMNFSDANGAFLVRLLQGAAHTLTAVLLVGLFRRFIPVWQSMLCGLPFLLWGFNAEAVIWFGGIQHVFGALLAVAGYVAVLRGQEQPNIGLRLLGGAFCAAAILTNQNPATACLILWLWHWVAQLETTTTTGTEPQPVTLDRQPQKFS